MNSKNVYFICSEYKQIKTMICILLFLKSEFSYPLYVFFQFPKTFAFKFKVERVSSKDARHSLHHTNDCQKWPVDFDEPMDCEVSIKVGCI